MLGRWLWLFLSLYGDDRPAYPPPFPHFFTCGCLTGKVDVYKTSLSSVMYLLAIINPIQLITWYQVVVLNTSVHLLRSTTTLERHGLSIIRPPPRSSPARFSLPPIGLPPSRGRGK